MASGQPVRTYETAFNLLIKIVAERNDGYIGVQQSPVHGGAWITIDGSWDLTADELALVNTMRGTTNG